MHEFPGQRWVALSTSRISGGIIRCHGLHILAQQSPLIMLYVIKVEGGSIEHRLELQIFVCAQPFNGYVGTVLPVQELSELGGTSGRWFSKRGDMESLLLTVPLQCKHTPRRLYTWNRYQDLTRYGSGHLQHCFCCSCLRVRWRVGFEMAPFFLLICPNYLKGVCTVYVP